MACPRGGFNGLSSANVGATLRTGIGAGCLGRLQRPLIGQRRCDDPSPMRKTDLHAVSTASHRPTSVRLEELSTASEPDEFQRPLIGQRRCDHQLDAGGLLFQGFQRPLIGQRRCDLAGSLAEREIIAFQRPLIGQRRCDLSRRSAATSPHWFQRPLIGQRRCDDAEDPAARGAAEFQRPLIGQRRCDGGDPLDYFDRIVSTASHRPTSVRPGSHMAYPQFHQRFNGLSSANVGATQGLRVRVYVPFGFQRPLIGQRRCD